MRLRRGYTLRAVLVSCVFTAAAWTAPKPVAIVAHGNASGGDVKFFKYYVTNKLGVVTEDCGSFLEPSEFEKYSLIAWLRSSPKALTAGQIEAMRRYLDRGGHVLATNGVPYTAFGRPFKNMDWIKAKNWGYNKNRWAGEVFDRDNPYFGGVPVDDPGWRRTYHGLLDHTGTRLLGEGRATTLGYTKVGKGRFIFSSYGPYDARNDKLKAAYMRLYRNIVMAAGPLTEEAQARSLMAEAAPGKRLVLWHRDWSGSDDRRLIWQPTGPRPDEVLTALDVRTVRDEIDTTFFCVQTPDDLGPVSVEVAPLGARQNADRVRALVMGRAPAIARKAPKHYAKADVSKRGPFYLLPPETLPPEGQPAFEIEPFEPRTIWVQVNTRGMAAGTYESRLRFAAAGGETLATLPIRVNVAPIRMPDPRVVQLRTWGGGIGDDVRLMREMQRQRCDHAHISYPDVNRIRLRNSNVTLRTVMRDSSHVRDKNPLPRLDFTGHWNERLDLLTRHGITNLSLKDIRTGAWWAAAATGETCDVTAPFERWPDTWRAAYVDYYAQMQNYLHERGYGMAFALWTDEPTMTTIRKNYLPRAKAYVQAGMGPGSHWTTPGWMKPEDTSLFLPWTRDVSMYQYGYPNLQGFLQEGSAELEPGSIVGFTRGGTGLAVRNPHVGSRLGPWSIVHQRPPVHFWRTGPIWKGWLYYVDFTGNQWFRLGGVQGERLLAYGASDTSDLSIDMLTSSDWEGAREGIDDANLARMVEWYLPRMKARAQGAWKQRLAEIEDERELWFTERSPFPIGTRPVDYHHKPKDGDPLEYHIRTVSASATRDLEAAKRYLVGLLEEMQPHARKSDIHVRWHAFDLVAEGAPCATVIVAREAGQAVKQAATSIADRIADVTGIRLPLRETDRPDDVNGVRILVGQAADKPVAELLRAQRWQLDKGYPGRGDYRIKRLPETKTVAVLGVDADGTVRGVKNWMAFLMPEGHWLLDP